MEIIPVIDLKEARAVRARMGDRASYGPLVTPLASSSDPLAVLHGYSDLYPFPILYVADLDGIEGRGADGRGQASLLAAWPGTEVWVDDGSLAAVPAGGGGTGARRVMVAGSESLAADGATWRRRLEAMASRGGEAVLSLDFRGEVFQGPEELYGEVGLWPSRVVVMTLARVGSSAGPDLRRLEAIVRKAGDDRRVYAAGGVRDAADCRRLRDLGVAGALVATALHDGKIKAGDLMEIAGC